MEHKQRFSPPLDKGIKKAVVTLTDAGIECFESCQGGKGHCSPEPFIKFHGEQPEGLKALSIAMYARLKVSELRRVWYVQDGEIIGPWWELIFFPTRKHT
jgi:hypothetical protein